MAILTYPLNGITYDAEDAEVYNCTRTTGVFAEDGHFPATVTGRLEVSIGPGLAWIQNEEFHGKAIYNPETVALAIEEADAHLTRIDRIVLRFDKLMNQTTLVVKTGTPASRPVAPDIERSSYIYELGLYIVTVKYSILSISDDCVENTFMDENVCGLMRDGVTRLPSQELYDQWHAWFVNLQSDTEQFEEQLQQWFYDVKNDFEKWESETKHDFEEWFDTVKDVLDADTAGKLQNEIDDLIERVTKLENLHFKYFAVYCEDDFSVIFYGDTGIPEAGDIYKGKKVTYVFTGEDDAYNWSDLKKICQRVSFDESFSEARPTTLSEWFYAFSALTSIDFTNLDTSDVTTMESLFSNCTKISDIDLSSLDTGNVTSMKGMFMFCSSLTNIDLSSLNSENVTDISYLFSNCSGLTSINWGKLDTSKVNDMRYMFNNCSGITSLDLSQLDTGNVTYMSNMFFGCSGLTAIDLSLMDTSKVTTMEFMFYGCSELKSIYSDDNKFVTTNVTSGSGMFTDCINLVGGNGTEYDSENVNYKMAHVDVEGNPGYFTAK